LLELSAKFYQLHFSKNKKALEYVFKKRLFTKETALNWRLGYSPNTGRALIDFAKSKGFSDKDRALAGII
jgi:DNA primase